MVGFLSTIVGGSLFSSDLEDGLTAIAYGIDLHKRVIEAVDGQLSLRLAARTVFGWYLNRWYMASLLAQSCKWTWNFS